MIHNPWCKSNWTYELNLIDSITFIRLNLKFCQNQERQYYLLMCCYHSNFHKIHVMSDNVILIDMMLAHECHSYLAFDIKYHEFTSDNVRFVQWILKHNVSIYRIQCSLITKLTLGIRWSWFHLRFNYGRRVDYVY